jgi:hypothetical protein
VSRSGNHWKLKRSLLTKGTLNKNFSNASNPDVNHTVVLRSEYKQNWTDFLGQIYDTDPNLPVLPPEMSWIDEVDLEQYKATARDFEIQFEDLDASFRKLKGKKSKAPGPNNLNYFLIEFAYRSNR